jgi:protoporphyrinogen oxidase
MPAAAYRGAGRAPLAPNGLADVPAYTPLPKKAHTVVIGAGPAGITAAYQLAKAGTPVVVLEASEHVGGMARTIPLWGQRVDIGPHRFFSSDTRVNALWLEVLGREYAMVDRLTRIHYGGQFYEYPLQPLDAFRKLGPVETGRCLASYAASRLGPARPEAGAQSFEAWVVSRFGRRLFEIFFKSYSEKLWGIACGDLDADFAAQRIKKLSMLEVLKNMVRAPGAQPRHKTLVDRFAYPLGGSGAVYEAMAEAVERAGGTVARNTRVRRVLTDDGRRVTGVELASGARILCDYVVSTMPVTSLVRGLDGVPDAVRAAAARLRFRNTLVVYLNVGATDLFPDQWLYVHSPELAVGRITNFRNWVPALYGDARTSILALEYWANDGDPLWQEAPELSVARAERELRQTGLIGNASVLGGEVVRVPKCYPVYERGYRAHLAPVVEHLRTYAGLLPIGRYGSFKYNNQDHSILMGMLAAEHVHKQGTDDLWGVNTDYEAYQEASVITETGLQPA